jgi:outer membrane protein assembly factor BamB
MATREFWRKHLAIGCRNGATALLAALAIAALALISSSNRAAAEDWPVWRGPRGDGTSTDQHAPIKWKAAGSEENIAWKVSLDGTGHSSPIISAGRIFVTACDEATGKRLLTCFDRATGKSLWQRDVLTAPLEFKHGLNSFASSTPAGDGEQVYVAFLEPNESGKGKSDATPGKMTVAAFNYRGEQQWRVQPGDFSSRHGFCSCPVLFKNLVILNGDHDGDAYLVALDRATGKTVWKTPRENKTRSYVTPIIREIDGRTQMVLSGSKCVASYDPNTGKRQWIVDGPTEQFVASMVFDGKLLFLTAGFPEHHIVALRPGGEGNVTDKNIVWRTTRGAAYVPSPVVIGDDLLVVSDEGIASCFDTATGTRHWTQRIGSHYSGSLVAAGGLAYFTDDSGVTKVVRPGKKFDLVSQNELGEHVFASLGVSDGQIFVRSEKHLYAIGLKPADDGAASAKPAPK